MITNLDRNRKLISVLKSKILKKYKYGESVAVRCGIDGNSYSDIPVTFLVHVEFTPDSIIAYTEGKNNIWVGVNLGLTKNSITFDKIKEADSVEVYVWKILRKESFVDTGSDYYFNSSRAKGFFNDKDYKTVLDTLKVEDTECYKYYVRAIKDVISNGKPDVYLNDNAYPKNADRKVLPVFKIKLKTGEIGYYSYNPTVYKKSFNYMNVVDMVDLNRYLYFVPTNLLKAKIVHKYVYGCL